MGIFQRIKQAFSPPRVKHSGKGYDFSLWQGQNFWGLSNSTLSKNETIYSIVFRLANTLASLPIHLYKDYDQQDNELSQLVSQTPNENMHAFDFMHRMEVSRDTFGNGYALIQRDANLNPVALLPVSADYVTPMVNIEDNSLWYRVTGEKQNMTVFNTEMIHVKHLQTVESLVGMSPIKVLHNALEFDNAVQNFNLGEMSKQDSFIVKYEKNVDKDKREALVDDFRTFVHDNGGVIFQEKGFDIQQIDRDFVSGDMVNTEKVTRSRIANVYNVPLNFLNESFSEGVSSNEQLMTQFVQMTLVPIVKQYEAEFNRKLLTEDKRAKGFYFKFNLNGLLRGDTAARTNFYQMMIRNGIASPNDLRKLEDMTPSDNPNADQLFVSGDLYPIDMDPTQRKGVTKNDTTKIPDNQTASGNQLGGNEH
ncbi:phage portal protein [Secundilactobacillus pentosiphilus]|uniref:Phage portal protein n=1 Tax=Secundilactobacillus pentosiphilus TaxID=1714682 RepID=A0A1Z5IZF3_9LACO|nr:phage portal protein [Secundilactobacillus pentosiphilus]GAX06952.1 phage portal protein [Secundilactobacillus pentosiphilus]